MTRNDVSFLNTYSVTLTRIKRACDLTFGKMRKIFLSICEVRFSRPDLEFIKLF